MEVEAIGGRWRVGCLKVPVPCQSCSSLKSVCRKLKIGNSPWLTVFCNSCHRNHLISGYLIEVCLTLLISGVQWEREKNWATSAILIFWKVNFILECIHVFDGILELPVAALRYLIECWTGVLTFRGSCIYSMYNGTYIFIYMQFNFTYLTYNITLQKKC